MHKRYLIIIIAILLAGISVHVALTIALDPYRVFGLSDFNKKNFEPNNRYLKIEHLRGDHGHDAFILGSSRVAAYDVKTAKKLSGFDYYNLTASGAGIKEILGKAQWLVQSQEIRQMIVGLDFDAMFLAGTTDPFDLLRKEHYLVSGEHPFLFYLKFFMFQPNTLSRVIKLNRDDKKITYLFDTSTGQVMFPYYDELIAKDHEAYVKTMITGPNTTWGKVKPGNLAAFNQMVDLLRSHDIDVIYVINPCHYLMMESYDIHEYCDWLRSIVGTGIPVWDFSGFNQVTENSYNYYEILHARKIVGDLVLERIFTGKCTSLDIDNFGRLISSENIEEHIARLKGSYFLRSLSIIH
ncbi:MAG TPA: hypothetical protein ENN05_03115 [Deltaproteobacteria bacterium]|nr:hypothetical protein [Deltaproteobacteria bacterium]